MAQRLIRSLLAVALAAMAVVPAFAQPTPGQVPVVIVASCGTATLTRGALTVTADGELCTTAAAGGTVTANQGTPAAVGNAWPMTLAIGGALNAVGNPVFVAPGTGATFVLGAGSAIAGNFRIDQTTPGTTNGVNIDPTTGSGAAIPPIVSGSAESNHVICAAACNLWGASITTGAAAGFFMVFNATSAPADGAVTPIECVQIPANGSGSINFGAGPPDRYATGVTLAFSTTGCFNLTKSATAFFKGRGV